MIHNCETKPLTVLADSRAKTLCDVCKSLDCENPIEKHKVSIVGIEKEMKVYVTRNSVAVVTKCDGFNP